MGVLLGTVTLVGAAALGAATLGAAALVRAATLGATALVRAATNTTPTGSNALLQPFQLQV